MQIIDIVIRFIITFLFSALFGLERQKSHKPAGFGTFTFVSVGACGLTILALELYPENPLSLLSAIVTGIGFLGAGALIKTTNKIFGFTTAASIWIFSIFGLIIGTGYYFIGLILYSLIWVTILIDKYFEDRGIGTYQKRVSIFANRIVPSYDIEGLLHAGKNHHLMSLEIDKKNKKFCYNYILEGSKEEINHKLQKIYDTDWCDTIKVE